MTTDLHDPDRLTSDFVPHLHEAMVMVEVADEAVLYDESSGHLHQLDAIGTVVCALFDGETTIRAMADDLAEAFGASRNTVEHDVLEMVRELGRAGVLAGVAGQSEETQQDDDADC